MKKRSWTEKTKNKIRNEIKKKAKREETKTRRVRTEEEHLQTTYPT